MIKALLLVGFSFFDPSVPADSTGTETIDGKVFVVHRVSEKETLYGISKRYGATIDEVLRYNPSADSGLEIGQVLKVPYKPKATTISVQRPATGGEVTHKVKEKETLYSISRAYNVSISDIKQWNRLSSDNLALGQELVIKKSAASPGSGEPVLATNQAVNGVHLVRAGETLFSLARQYGITLNELREWNNLQGVDLKVGQSLVVAPPAKNETAQVTFQPVSAPPQEQETVKVETSPVTHAEAAKTEVISPSTSKVAIPESKPIIISEGVRGSDEVIQGGLAELIDGTEGNRKYLALHRTAPVGTILKVRNEMNNREVFVRVMGKLPDTALTDKVIIKISRSAYDRLGAIDPRFRVEVTYYKPNSNN